MKKECLNFTNLNSYLISNTNKRLIRFEMLRRKVEHMAIDSGYTMGQFLILACYNSVVEWD